MTNDKIASDQSLERAELLRKRVGRRLAAPIARDFLRAHDGQPSALVRLLRGGQGGEIRLKLYLTFLWLAAKEPYQIRPWPNSAWAEYLDIEDPMRKGARRVNDAINWLEHEGFVLVERARGKSPLITLLDGSASGGQYRPPYQRGAYHNIYVPLANAFYTEGWIQVLSARAVALLLISLDQTLRPQKAPCFWVSPKRANEWYGLSQDTWTRATKELVQHSILFVHRISVEETGDSRWNRNEYCLNPERMLKLAGRAAGPGEIEDNNVPWTAML